MVGCFPLSIHPRDSEYLVSPEWVAVLRYSGLRAMCVENVYHWWRFEESQLLSTRPVVSCELEGEVGSMVMTSLV